MLGVAPEIFLDGVTDELVAGSVGDHVADLGHSRVLNRLRNQSDFRILQRPLLVLEGARGDQILYRISRQLRMLRDGHPACLLLEPENVRSSIAGINDDSLQVVVGLLHELAVGDRCWPVAAEKGVT